MPKVQAMSLLGAWSAISLVSNASRQYMLMHKDEASLTGFDCGQGQAAAAGLLLVYCWSAAAGLQMLLRLRFVGQGAVASACRNIDAITLPALGNGCCSAVVAAFVLFDNISQAYLIQIP